MKRKGAHFGCGRVYLLDDEQTEWTNYDIPHADTVLESDYPELVAELGTTDANYYGVFAALTAEQVAGKRVGENPKSVCDAYGAPWDHPAGLAQVDEILTRQMMEHLSDDELQKCMAAFDYQLKPGGILRIDVPDFDATVKAIDEATGDERALLIRHLTGPRRRGNGRHLQGFNRAEIIELATLYGFDFIGEEDQVPHRLYPAFCLRFRKPEARIDSECAWEYLVRADDVGRTTSAWRSVPAPAGAGRAPTWWWTSRTAATATCRPARSSTTPMCATSPC